MSDRPVLKAKRRFLVRAAVGVVAFLAYGQANYVAGFDSGTDTSLCVFNDMMFHERHDACGRLWINSPAMIGVRVWRFMSGDAVPGAKVIEG